MAWLVANFLLAAFPEPYFSLLVATTALMLAILIGYIAIRLIGRWSKAQTAGWSDTNSDFSTFRELFESGKLTAEEYERIRSRLGTQLRTEAGAVKQDPATEEPLTEIQILDPMLNPPPPPSPEAGPPPSEEPKNSP